MNHLGEAPIQCFEALIFSSETLQFGGFLCGWTVFGGGGGLGCCRLLRWSPKLRLGGSCCGSLSSPGWAGCPGRGSIRRVAPSASRSYAGWAGCPGRGSIRRVAPFASRSSAGAGKIIFKMLCYTGYCNFAIQFGRFPMIGQCTLKRPLSNEVEGAMELSGVNDCLVGSLAFG